MYIVYLVLLAAIVAAGQIVIGRAPVTETLLLRAFLGHYFKSDDIARYIGWPAGNPFQNEIGIVYALAIPIAIRRRQSP